MARDPDNSFTEKITGRKFHNDIKHRTTLTYVIFKFTVCARELNIALGNTLD